MTQARGLLIHPDDTVIVLLSPVIAAGTAVRANGETLVANKAIPTGHKIARRAIAAGHAIVKYGQEIGRALFDIAAGDHVHTHNVETTLSSNLEYRFSGRYDADYSALHRPENRRDTFNGYVRANGSVGIRNEIWVLCTVGCINRLAERIAALGHARLAGEKGVDGVYAFTHPYGCAQIGDDLLQTRRAIASLAAHPNCGGLLLMGLGCENNIIQEQVAAMRGSDLNRMRVFSAQTVEDEISAATTLLDELAAVCAADVRTTVPASQLILGMKCGGSDGFSGLTANPLVGTIADWHAAQGGISVLTEVPEMFGAEQLLMRRAASETVFRQTETLINGFKDYFRRYDEPISENPAPGNKAGGITTLEEKSLGCIQKGGAIAPIIGVTDYGEAIADSDTGATGGIVLANGPGNDGVSCTTLAMTGAQMVLFTTGRGTPFGTCVPTVKIATNSDLAQRKPHWIDFDAGGIADGLDKNELAATLWNQILATASGETHTCNEGNEYREIVIWKDGVTT